MPWRQMNWRLAVALDVGSTTTIELRRLVSSFGLRCESSAVHRGVRDGREGFGAQHRQLLDGELWAVRQRKLPIASLGIGRMSLAGNAQTQLHHVWFEHAPTSGNVRRASQNVRQVLSGIGAELGIVVVAGVVPDALGKDDTLNILAYLYPLAFGAPGPQHILDSARQLVLANSPWWPQWRTQAKAACQWLQQDNHRHRQPRTLGADKGNSPTSWTSMSVSLGRGAGRLAHLTRGVLHPSRPSGHSARQRGHTAAESGWPPSEWPHPRRLGELRLVKVRALTCFCAPFVVLLLKARVSWS